MGLLWFLPITVQIASEYSDIEYSQSGFKLCPKLITKFTKKHFDETIKSDQPRPIRDIPQGMPLI